jgi:hypothetical protein
MKRIEPARWEENIFLAVFMLWGAYIFYRTFLLPPSYHQTVGAAVYPRFIVGLLTILFSAVFIQKSKVKRLKVPAEIETQVHSDSRPPLLISALVVIAYGLGFTFVGYFVSSFIFIVILISVLSDYSPGLIPRAVLISTSVTGLIYLFLVKFLNLYFPESWLF